MTRLSSSYVCSFLSKLVGPSLFRLSQEPIDAATEDDSQLMYDSLSRTLTANPDSEAVKKELFDEDVTALDAVAAV